MNFGPMELAAYLRRKDAGCGDSAAVRAARDAVPPPSSNRLTIVSGFKEMRRVPRDPTEIPVHVYEAIVTRTSPPSPDEPVRVQVKSPHSVVLVLSSHQPIDWQIERVADTRLEAVLVAGCGQSQVQGAGDAPVASIGGFYAFRRGSGEFRHLEDQVKRLTGRMVARFRCVYSSAHFDATFE